MNWKEFLKLDKRKILFTAIFTIVAIFIIFVCVAPAPSNRACYPILIILVPMILLPTSLFTSDYAPIIYLLFYFFVIVYWYLLSCIIAFIYNESRKKK